MSTMQGLPAMLFVIFDGLHPLLTDVGPSGLLEIWTGNAYKAVCTTLRSVKLDDAIGL